MLFESNFKLAVFAVFSIFALVMLYFTIKSVLDSEKENKIKDNEEVKKTIKKAVESNENEVNIETTYISSTASNNDNFLNKFEKNIKKDLN